VHREPVIRLRLSRGVRLGEILLREARYLKKRFWAPPALALEPFFWIHNVSMSHFGLLRGVHSVGRRYVRVPAALA
jgi:hypothetical protein